MLRNDPHVGAPRSRVDGPAKVTGSAAYAAEFDAPGLLHGYVVGSAIARGKIASLDASAAEALPGVVAVFWHKKRPAGAWRAAKYRDDVGPPGSRSGRSTTPTSTTADSRSRSWWRRASRSPAMPRRWCK